MKKFIITGCPRSGTTYLSSILNSNQSFLKYKGEKIFRQNSSYKKFTGKLMRNLLKKYPVNEIEKYSKIINNNKSFFSIKGFLKNLIFRHRQLLLKIFR